MYHPEVAHYEGDPRYELAVAVDDAYRRTLAEQFDSQTVDAIMHGETLDARGRVISSLGDAAMTGAYSAGAEIVTEFESVNPLDILEADEAQESDEQRGGKYDGIREAMRRKVDLSHGSSKNPKRRLDPAAMLRPTSAQMHQRLMVSDRGRPRRGSETRITVGPRVDPQTKNAFMKSGESMGDMLDMVATFIHRGLSSSKIRDILQNATQRDTIVSTLPSVLTPGEINQDLPRCS